MNNADEIRKQIQEAKDGIIDAVCCCEPLRNGLQYLVSTGLLERLVNDLHTLERQLIEMERVILKPVPSHDSLRLGQEYYLLCKKGVSEMTLNTSRSGKETQSMVVGVIDKQIFIPVGEPNE